MADTDVLFDLRNYFYLGNYQAAINEANNVSLGTEKERLEKDSFVYRSYLAQGNYQLVLDEISDSAPAPLQAIKLLSTYLSNESKEAVLKGVKQCHAEGSTNPIVQLIMGTIYYHEQNFEEALKSLHSSNSLEGLSLLIQTYLKIDRLDLAEKEVKTMNKIDVDSTLTQLATAWVDINLGGDKIQEAALIFKELSDKYGATVSLLNGQAVCNIHMKKFEEAEQLLLEALEKNSKDADTIVNLITCYLHSKKPIELVNRYISQLKASVPHHPWVEALRNADEAFERSRTRFSI